MTDRAKEHERAIKMHNGLITEIKGFEQRFDSLSPYELAKLEYKYSQVEKLAWKICGYYKAESKYYEGMARVSEGTTYKTLREQNKMTAKDAEMEAKIAKGNMEIEAGIHDGDYTSWRGWANSYEGSRNSIKDMIKAIEKEGGS